MALFRARKIMDLALQQNKNTNKDDVGQRVPKMPHQETHITAASLFASMQVEHQYDIEPYEEERVVLANILTENKADGIIVPMLDVSDTIPSEKVFAVEIVPGILGVPATQSVSVVAEVGDQNIDNNTYNSEVADSENDGEGSDETVPAEPRKKKLKAEKPPIQEPCKETCKKKCISKVSQVQREQIHREFWSLKYNGQRDMIFKHVTRKHKLRTTKGDEASKRNMTFEYNLPNADGAMQGVCKVFFLGTLGYHPKNDRIITTVMQTTSITSVSATKDMRGRHTNRPHTMNTVEIADHIESFNPCVSHYRREHAPLRRYLPSDISIRSMYNDYKSTNPQRLVTYESYRKVVSDGNISFAKLGEEECEKCVKQEQHQMEVHHDGPNGQRDTYDQDCEQCQNHMKHKEGAKLARGKYREDAEKDWGREFSVCSVDLQKVIMLPRMPGNKTPIFTKRIVAYHETFAALGSKECKKGVKKDTISVIWHEGIAKRSAEEITSAFVSAFQRERDVTNHIIWLDNCTAQNKNWCLFTSMVLLINSDKIMAQDITFKYFEPGHTFMSADSFHHGVESEMRKRPGGNVYDFPDFRDVIQKSNGGRVVVVEMANGDFLAYKGGQSAHRLRQFGEEMLLRNMVVVQFRRGSKQIHLKNRHDQEDFSEIEFLKKNFKLEMPGTLRAQNRGIMANKKTDIVEKLCPLMPQNRRHFWVNLAVGNCENDETV